MKRFELDCAYRKGDSYSHWWPTNHEVALIDWMHKNVGPWLGCSYSLPFRATGWSIHLGYSEDPDLDDWSWRHLNLAYKPKGLFGHWLQVDDDNAAVILILSGVLDPCLYDGHSNHRDHDVWIVRGKTRSPRPSR